MACDLGRTGKTAFCVLQGDNFFIRCAHMEAIPSIAAPEVETHIKTINSMFHPSIIVMELNGPGGVFIDFALDRNPTLPIVAVDTSLPGVNIPLWNEIALGGEEFQNLRAEMYWILRLLFRDQRIKFPREDAELWSQLSTIKWTFDENKKDRILLESKKNMRLAQYRSELGPAFSSSPDKADSLALASLGYAIIQAEVTVAQTTGEEVDEVISPDAGFEGFIPLGKAGISVG